MRVRAIATASPEANAIGSVELECTPSGLALGLYGVGAYQDGYAPGPLAQGTRITVPYSAIVRVVTAPDGLLLDVVYPGFPHDRLHLARFSAGPGVPLDELRRRRMILHVVAGSLAVSAAVAAAILSPALPAETVGLGALAYALLAGTGTLGLGFALDRQFFTSPPGAEAVQDAFARDLAAYVTGVQKQPHGATPPRRPEQPALAGWVPRAAALVGLVVAAFVLTALVSGQRLLVRQKAQAELAGLERRPSPVEDEPLTNRLPTPTGAPALPRDTLPRDTLPRDHGLTAAEQPPPARAPSTPTSGEVLTPLKRCLCDRADSQLWTEPIPVLSALLLEKRTVTRRTHTRLALEVAVVNNGDTPIDELTIHVEFAERTPGEKPRHTAERPLYFEGPLQPGQAIKWSTEARGTEFEIHAPDVGVLGPNGEGSAKANQFAELLEANHRPVRLHAARMLSYLGDERGRAGALRLREAMRAAEGPYLRRVLSATADVRVCDVDRNTPGEVGVCVYNAGDEESQGLGIAVTSLHGSLDTHHPLANPPEVTAVSKWKVDGALPAQAGVYVRPRLPAGFLPNSEHTIEVNADRFDLLD
jgi:hypothetical protein